MDQNQIIIVALFAIGMILAAVSIYLFKAYIAPWIEKKQQLITQQIGDEEYAALIENIKTFMASAEVQLGAGNGKAKSELVIGWIQELFPGVDAQYIQALIDGYMKTLANQGILHMKDI